MYSECVTCPKLGVSCDGPNFVAMPAAELMAWCKARKAYLGLSNQKLAELANMSKGTVDGLLANAHADFRYESIRPMLKVLIGGDWNGVPCPDPTASERAAYEEKIHQLEKEMQWRDENIARLEKTNASLETLVANTNARYTKDKDFLRSEMKQKNITIIILAALFGLCLTVIVAALIVDYLNNNKGFFWLSNLFTPNGGLDSIKETAKHIMYILRG